MNFGSGFSGGMSKELSTQTFRFAALPFIPAMVWTYQTASCICMTSLLSTGLSERAETFSQRNGLDQTTEIISNISFLF